MEQVICLAGPTAAGKTASLQALADKFPVEVISMDSANIYREMDIGTAKPTPEERRHPPHHLIDILDPSQHYSAAQFCQDARKLIAAALAKGHVPLLAGGTMMYYKALRDGLNDLPPGDPAIRAALEDKAAEHGWPAMHQRLAQFDPATAARLAANDSQRIQRALEIIEITGKPLSEHFKQAPHNDPDFRFVTVSLEPSDRHALHERIEHRFHGMMEAGFLEEVQALWDRGDLHDGMPSIRCVGYRQLWGHLAGEYSLEDAVERGIIATRQLAKRQLTWLRSLPERHRIDCLAADRSEQVTAVVSELLKG